MTQARRILTMTMRLQANDRRAVASGSWWMIPAIRGRAGGMPLDSGRRHRFACQTHMGLVISLGVGGQGVKTKKGERRPGKRSASCAGILQRLHPMARCCARRMRLPMGQRAWKPVPPRKFPRAGCPWHVEIPTARRRVQVALAAFCSRACLAWPTRALKSSAAWIAMSERTLRSICTPAAFKPSMKRL